MQVIELSRKKESSHRQPSGFKKGLLGRLRDALKKNKHFEISWYGRTVYCYALLGIISKCVLGLLREVEKQFWIHRISNIGILGDTLKDMAYVPAASCFRSSMLSSKGIFCQVFWERYPASIYIFRFLMVTQMAFLAKSILSFSSTCTTGEKIEPLWLHACLSFSAGYARFMFHSRVFVCVCGVCVCVCVCVFVLSCGLVHR